MWWRPWQRCSLLLNLTEPPHGVETNDNDRMMEMMSPMLHDCRDDDEVDDSNVHIVVAVVLLRLLNLGHFLLQWCHNTNSDCRMDIVVAAENNYHILVVCSTLEEDRRVVGNYGNNIVLRRSWYDDQ